MTNYFEAFGGKLTGTIGVEPLDPQDPNTTAHIIRTINPLEVTVVWELDGDVAAFLGGKWTLRLTGKRIDGDGDAKELGIVTIPLDTVPAAPLPRRYTYKFVVEPDAVEPGIYQLVVALHYRNLLFDGPISAFAEVGNVEFFTAPHPAHT